MALYDHRVFKVDKNWWVAQVHFASGGGFLAKPQITSERVLFTNITNDKETSRSARIRPGMLNRLGHYAIRRLLDRAERMDSRFAMHPYNAPSPHGLDQLRRFVDDEGLQWVVQQTTAVRRTPTGPQALPAIEVICLDDSALRKEILLQNETTYTDAKLAPVIDIDQELIRVVKSTYEDPGADLDVDS